MEAHEKGRWKGRQRNVEGWIQLEMKHKKARIMAEKKGKGTGKPGKPGKPGNIYGGIPGIHDTARYSQRHPQQPWKLVSHELAEATDKWEAWPSHVLLEPDGLADFARRNTNFLGPGCLPEFLITELPDDPSAVAWREEGWDVPMPATGGAGDMPATGGAQEEAWKLIKDLCLRHRGEVRELSGNWQEFDGPVPREVLNPQFNGSFVRVSGALATTGQLAAGIWPRRGELEIRHARVFSLADLFVAFGEWFTAAELYAFYVSCRVIAMRRQRGQRAW